jgi:hypothetical protein
MLKEIEKILIINLLKEQIKKETRQDIKEGIKHTIEKIKKI